MLVNRGNPPLGLCVNSFGHPGCRGLDRNSAFVGVLFPHQTYDASTIEEEPSGGATAKERGHCAAHRFEEVGDGGRDGCDGVGDRRTDLRTDIAAR